MPLSTGTALYNPIDYQIWIGELVDGYVISVMNFSSLNSYYNFNKTIDDLKILNINLDFLELINEYNSILNNNINVNINKWLEVFESVEYTTKSYNIDILN